MLQIAMQNHTQCGKIITDFAFRFTPLGEFHLSDSTEVHEFRITVHKSSCPCQKLSKTKLSRS